MASDILEFDSVEQRQNALADPDAFKPEVKSTEKNFEHFTVANQTIKTIHSLPMDPFVKKVMTMRILAPIYTGKEKTHMAIALELGAPVNDVIQAEAYGINCVSKAMENVSNQDFINKFNADKQLDNIVKAEIEKRVTCQN